MPGRLTDSQARRFCIPAPYTGGGGHTRGMESTAWGGGVLSPGSAAITGPNPLDQPKNRRPNISFRMSSKRRDDFHRNPRRRRVAPFSGFSQTLADLVPLRRAVRGAGEPLQRGASGSRTSDRSAGQASCVLPAEEGGLSCATRGPCPPPGNRVGQLPASRPTSESESESA